MLVFSHLSVEEVRRGGSRETITDEEAKGEDEFSAVPSLRAAKTEDGQKRKGKEVKKMSKMKTKREKRRKTCRKT